MFDIIGIIVASVVGISSLIVNVILIIKEFGKSKKKEEIDEIKKELPHILKKIETIVSQTVSPKINEEEIEMLEKIARADDKSPLKNVDFLLKLGNIKYFDNKYNDAMAHYKDALEQARFTNDRIAEAKCLGNIGAVYRYTDLDEALRYHAESLAISQEIGYNDGKVVNLGCIGIILKDKGELDEAMEYFREALKINEEIESKKGQAINLGSIGVIYRIKGELDEAMKYCIKTLELNRAIGNESGEASNLGNIGLIYHNKGELDMAMKFYNEALLLNRKVGFERGEAINLRNIGIVYHDKGEYDKAIEKHQEALAISRKIGHKKGEGTNLRNVGEVFFNQGHIVKALNQYKDSNKLLKQIGYKRGIAISSGNIGIAFKKKGDHKKGKKYLISAIGIYDDHGFSDEYIGKFKNALDEIEELEKIEKPKKGIKQ